MFTLMIPSSHTHMPMSALVHPPAKPDSPFMVDLVFGAPHTPTALELTFFRTDLAGIRAFGQSIVDACEKIEPTLSRRRFRRST